LTGTGLVQTTGLLQSRGISIRNVSDVEVATISNLGRISTTTADIVSGGNIYNNGAYSGSDYIYTSSGDIQTALGSIYTNNGNIYTLTGNLQSRGLTIKNTSDINVATISNLGALVCTTIQNNGNTLNCGNITSGSIDSGSNLIQTTGSLRSRGISVRNTLDSEVASISNVGDITCVDSVSNTLTSSSLTIQDAIPTGNIRASISGSGLVTGTGFTIKDITSTTVARILATGAIECGPITSGAITSSNGNINAGTGTITGTVLTALTSITAPAINSSAPNFNIIIGGTQTSGRIDIGNNALRTGAINIATNVTGTHSINIGNSASFQTININRPLTCYAITTNNNTINAGNGSITGGGLTILDPTFVNVASISTAGDISGKSLTTTSNIVTSGGSINANIGSINGASVNASSTMKTPSINSLSITTDLDISPNQSSGNINVGNPSIMVTQKLQVRRSITIQYPPSISYHDLGGSMDTTMFSTYISVPTGTVKTIGTISNVPAGLYLIFYSFVFRISVSDITFTKQEYGISSVLDSFGTTPPPTFGDLYDLETTSQIRTTSNTARLIVTKSNTINIDGPTTNVRLTCGAIYTGGGSLTVGGSIKLMRIG
jgi:hypothetical protein